MLVHGFLAMAFFLAVSDPEGAARSSCISLVRTLVSVEGRRSFSPFRGRCAGDLLDHDVVPLDRSGRPVGVEHHPSPARGELGVLGREILGLDVPDAGFPWRFCWLR